MPGRNVAFNLSPAAARPAEKKRIQWLNNDLKEVETFDVTGASATSVNPRHRKRRKDPSPTSPDPVGALSDMDIESLPQGALESSSSTPVVKARGFNSKEHQRTFSPDSSSAAPVTMFRPRSSIIDGTYTSFISDSSRSSRTYVTPSLSSEDWPPTLESEREYSVDDEVYISDDRVAEIMGVSNLSLPLECCHISNDLKRDQADVMRFYRSGGQKKRPICTETSRRKAEMVKFCPNTADNWGLGYKKPHWI